MQAEAAAQSSPSHRSVQLSVARKLTHTVISDVLLAQGVKKVATVAKERGVRVVLVSAFLVHPKNWLHPVRIILNYIVRYKFMNEKVSPPHTACGAQSICEYLTAPRHVLRLLVTGVLLIHRPCKVCQHHRAVYTARSFV